MDVGCYYYYYPSNLLRCGWMPFHRKYKPQCIEAASRPNYVPSHSHEALGAHDAN